MGLGLSPCKSLYKEADFRTHSSAYPPTSTTERPYRYFNPDEDVSSTPVKPVVADSAYSSPGTARTRIETTRSEGKRQLSADEIHEVVEERLTPERRVRLVERLRDAMKEVHVGRSAANSCFFT